MRGYLLAFLALPILLTATLQAQTTTGPTELGLSAHLTFDGNFEDATGATVNAGAATGTPEFACGVNGTSLSLNGMGDAVSITADIPSNVNQEFDDEDFTVSFYFKHTGTSTATQFLLAKRDTNCMNLQFFTIRYAPLTRTLAVTLRQNNQQAQILYPITNDFCWQHVVVARQENGVRLFVNTEEVAEARTSSPVDISNEGGLTVGTANCLNPGESSFEGLIDELRIYNRALREAEVATLYLNPDRILNDTRRVFLGEVVPINLNSTCGVDFQWTPTEGVDDPNAQNPEITPREAGNQTYTVAIQDAESNCVALDSIPFQVIDPAELDCSQIFLPKAFTPNGIGPAENETFGISNPFAISELLSFEVYDRYGAQMFQTTDPFSRWDGSFNGDPVEPGVVVWRVVYRCEGQEEVESGSVMVLR